MGKAARQHTTVTGFTPEDVDAIAQHYIHCSAHWNAVELRQNGELQGGASASKPSALSTGRTRAGQERFTTWMETKDEKALPTDANTAPGIDWL
jgi:hypothetical protein